MKPEENAGLSIFARLLIAFLSVNIVTASILIFSGYRFTDNAVEKRTKEAITQQVKAIAIHFDQNYRINLNRAMDGLVSSSQLNDYLLTSKTQRMVAIRRLERLFKLTIAEYEDYEAISFVDLGGHAVVNIIGKARYHPTRDQPSSGLHGYPSEPAVSAAAAQRMFEEASAEPLLGQNTPWDLSSREVEFYGPYLEDNGDIKALAGRSKMDLDIGEFGGVVMVRLSLNSFFAYLKSVKFFDANPIWVLDVDGEVLQRPENARITFDPRVALPPGVQPIPRLVTVDEGLIAYQDFAVVGNQPFMRVAVSIPSSLLRAELAPTAQFFSLVLMISIGIVLLVSLYVSRYLTRPVVELASAAARLAGGDLDTRVTVKSTGEVHTLVESFNAMTENLRTSAIAREATLSSLENEVAERFRVEEELKQQAADLEEARLTAEAAGKAKGEFLATMSHEIRTPINGILGMTELLLHTTLTDKQAHFAQSARRSGEALLGIINDILDFSKIEAGKLELEKVPFDLRELVDDMGQLFAESAQSKGLELICSLPQASHTAFMGDVGRMRQILTNLFGNSIKFTEAGEVALRVTTSIEEEDSAIVTFEVIDTGIGIDEMGREKIFKSFEQADASTTRRYGGTGLGLAISKQLAELMGGEIGVNSVTNEGSTFWLQLKLEKRRALESNQVMSRRVGMLKVLAVDDNPSNRDILDNQLEGWGIEHVVIESPRQALQTLREAALEEVPFDAVLLDMHMPEMDGLELAHAIKLIPSLAPTRLIMLSSALHDNEGERRQAGIELHLSKPIRQNDLYNALLTLVSADPFTSNVSKPAPDTGPRLSGRVLAAEDNAVNQEMVRGSLSLLGLESQIVDNGEAALEAWTEGGFDLILMDCRMPHMDGFVACETIRKREASAGRGEHIPIVALTANALSGDRERCLAAGMDDYLSKPFTIEQLRQRLEVWLNGEEQKDDGPSEVILDQGALDTLRKLDQGSNSNVLEKVISLFIETSAELVDKLRTGAATGNAVEIENAAHTLKTSGANVGAMTLNALCKDLELMGREKNIESAAELVAQVEVELEGVCRALTNIQESRAA